MENVNNNLNRRINLQRLDKQNQEANQEQKLDEQTNVQETKPAQEFQEQGEKLQNAQDYLAMQNQVALNTNKANNQPEADDLAGNVVRGRDSGATRRRPNPVPKTPIGDTTGNGLVGNIQRFLEERNALSEYHDKCNAAEDTKDKEIEDAKKTRDETQQREIRAMDQYNMQISSINQAISDYINNKRDTEMLGIDREIRRLEQKIADYNKTLKEGKDAFLEEHHEWEEQYTDAQSNLTAAQKAYNDAYASYKEIIDEYNKPETGPLALWEKAKNEHEQRKSEYDQWKEQLELAEQAKNAALDTAIAHKAALKETLDGAIAALNAYTPDTGVANPPDEGDEDPKQPLTDEEVRNYGINVDELRVLYNDSTGYEETTYLGCSKDVDGIYVEFEIKNLYTKKKSNQREIIKTWDEINTSGVGTHGDGRDEEPDPELTRLQTAKDKAQKDYDDYNPYKDKTYLEKNQEYEQLKNNSKTDPGNFTTPRPNPPEESKTLADLLLAMKDAQAAVKELEDNEPTYTEPTKPQEITKAENDLQSLKDKKAALENGTYEDEYINSLKEQIANYNTEIDKCKERITESNRTYEEAETAAKAKCDAAKQKAKDDYDKKMEEIKKKYRKTPEEGRAVDWESYFTSDEKEAIKGLLPKDANILGVTYENGTFVVKYHYIEDRGGAHDQVMTYNFYPDANTAPTEKGSNEAGRGDDNADQSGE